MRFAYRYALWEFLESILINIIDFLDEYFDNYKAWHFDFKYLTFN